MGNPAEPAHRPPCQPGRSLLRTRRPEPPLLGPGLRLHVPALPRTRRGMLKRASPEGSSCRGSSLRHTDLNPIAWRRTAATLNRVGNRSREETANRLAIPTCDGATALDPTDREQFLPCPPQPLPYRMRRPPRPSQPLWRPFPPPSCASIPVSSREISVAWPSMLASTRSVCGHTPRPISRCALPACSSRAAHTD